MNQEEIFYIWGPLAYSYFDSTLDYDQMYTTLQNSPITDIWFTKKKSTEELSSFCYLISGIGNIAHLTLRNQFISTEEGLSSICTLLDSLPNLKYLDLSNRLYN